LRWMGPIPGEGKETYAVKASGENFLELMRKSWTIKICSSHPQNSANCLWGQFNDTGPLLSAENITNCLWIHSCQKSKENSLLICCVTLARLRGLCFVFYCFIIHRCIQGLGHFSPLPPPPRGL
jgi:hypothetical protein